MTNERLESGNQTLLQGQRTLAAGDWSEGCSVSETSRIVWKQGHFSSFPELVSSVPGVARVKVVSQ